MARPKRIVTVAATFASALGIGFVMQYGDALASRFVGDAPEPVALTDAQAEAVAALGENGAAVAPLPSDVEIVAIIGDTPVAAPEAAVEEPIVLAAVEEAVPPVIDASIVASEPNCDITMTATAQPYAMVDITVETACYASETFVVHHQGMMFTAITSRVGVFNTLVPALAQDAFFIAAFNNGEGAIAQVDVPDLAQYDRAVLQWQGRQDMFLHAREFGAAYGSDGHLTMEDLRHGDMSLMDAGAGGYINQLGYDAVENPLMAEVYSFPTGKAAADANVLLTAEAQITEDNCGREITAQSLQIIPGAEAQANDLVMMMPDCNAVGEFLVLKNMFLDLTLASR